MAKSLVQLNAQIEKLQKEAAAIRAKEVSGVVKRIHEAIEHYGLTIEDLFGQSAGKAAKRVRAAKSQIAVAPGKRKRGPSPTKGRKVAVKYRDSAGNTWTGRGNKPRWLTAELAAGKSLDSFAV